MRRMKQRNEKKEAEKKEEKSREMRRMKQKNEKKEAEKREEGSREIRKRKVLKWASYRIQPLKPHNSSQQKDENSYPHSL